MSDMNTELQTSAAAEDQVQVANEYLAEVFKHFADQNPAKEIAKDPDALKLMLQLNGAINTNFVQMKRLGIEEKGKITDRMVQEMARQVLEKMRENMSPSGRVIDATAEVIVPELDLPDITDANPDRLHMGRDFRGSFDDMVEDYREHGAVTLPTKPDESSERLIRSDPAAIIPPDLA